MKKLLIILGVLLVVGGGALTAGYFAYDRDIETPVGGNQAKVFTIHQGEDAEQIGTRLEAEGLIRSKWSFLLYIKRNKISGSIKAGTYLISPANNTAEIVAQITEGKVAKRKVTIPEGLTIKKMAPRFEAAGVIQGADFLSAVKKTYDFDFLKGASTGLEGYLFPDTYFFEYGTSASGVVSAMLENFQSKLTAELSAGFKKQGLTLHKAVTLASMVEVEARDDEQRRVIAGILFNRLKDGMLLQVDATVNYITGREGSSPTGTELGIDSPYNTYKYHGLPPGPIAAPGLSSLKAVANPAKTPYFFYCHSSKGEIFYGRNGDEHTANLPKCQ